MDHLIDPGGKLPTHTQLADLESSLHRGSAQASKALASWIGKPSVVEIDSLQRLPLDQATAVLAGDDEPLCFCAMEIQGVLSGEMILAFDDASGLALADMLLGQPRGTTTQWTEMATSAALETTNIVCCAYLNSLAACLSSPRGAVELVPAPPTFSREFAESLMEFALMDQAISLDQVILATTRFQIDGVPVKWTLLFVPDAASMSRLAELLVGNSCQR